MRPIKKCGKPIDGTLLYNPSEGATENVSLGFDLDKAQPRAQLVDLNDPDLYHGDYFSGKSVTLAPGERQVFHLIASTTRYDCRYRIVVTVVDRGRDFSLTIGDGDPGTPFEITASAPPKDPRCRYSGYRSIYRVGASQFDVPAGKRSESANPRSFGCQSG